MRAQIVHPLGRHHVPRLHPSLDDASLRLVPADLTREGHTVVVRLGLGVALPLSLGERIGPPTERAVLAVEMPELGHADVLVLSDPTLEPPIRLGPEVAPEPTEPHAESSPPVDEPLVETHVVVTVRVVLEPIHARRPDLKLCLRAVLQQYVSNTIELALPPVKETSS